MSLQLETDIWVQALTRRANAAGCYSSVERIGDRERGDVLIKVVDGAGAASVYGQVFSPEPEAVFKRLPDGAPATTEPAASDYINRRIANDPDVWVVEIMDKTGRHFITERVLPDVDPFG